jgi:hypothetical protein
METKFLFLDGRTETVRSVGNESVAFVKAASQPIMSVEDRQLKVNAKKSFSEFVDVAVA